MGDEWRVELRNALARANSLRSRVAEANRQIGETIAQMRVDTAELRRLERVIASSRAPVRVEGFPSGRPTNPDRRDVADRALQLIRAAGRPLPRRELFRQLAEAGVSLNGKDPEMVLGTMLYRDDRIVRLRGYGYWPRDEVYEAAFYIPEHEAVIGATAGLDE